MWETSEEREICKKCWNSHQFDLKEVPCREKFSPTIPTTWEDRCNLVKYRKFKEKV